MGEDDMLNDMELASYLAEIEVFKSMSRSAAVRLAHETTEERFAAGTVILHRGGPGDCMYVIVEGMVQVPILDPKGQQQFVAQLGAKQIFGEMALLTGEARSADVIAGTDCRCLKLSRDVVEALIREQPEVAELLTSILGERLLKAGTIRQIGKYHLTGELGRGAMSIVYEGIHPTLERPVAVKMLSHRLACRDEFRQRFRNEARLISRLRHPNIVEVFDTETAYATFFIIMERLHGQALQEVISHQGRIPFERCREILRQLASALGEAHRQGVVHRDLKPGNVMIGADGAVKLLDFGLALDQAVNGQQADPSLSGTPMYMAPEQIAGQPVDGRTDIYALGVMAYEMLLGTPPFTGPFYKVLEDHRSTPVPPPRQQLADVPEDLNELVRRATSKDPAARFGSCDEILALLGVPSALSGLAIDTLTFVYPPDRASQVEPLLTEIRKQARKIPDLIVR